MGTQVKVAYQEATLFVGLMAFAVLTMLMLIISIVLLATWVLTGTSYTAHLLEPFPAFVKLTYVLAHAEIFFIISREIANRRQD